MYLSCWGPNN
ncbi:hypothetical protein TIFTF001_051701 [Ficus carica]|uniref:Uncharacterized protein n=1 Tax=Ficus carica TaxID=3494 RepID=A0AA87Z431_FICCA|nr:hypothetical protein TIFTF001_051701 [Ficus carica]